MRTHFHRKSSVFPVIKNSNFQIFPKSSPRPFCGVRKYGKKLEKHRISFEIRCFYGDHERSRYRSKKNIFTVKMMRFQDFHIYFPIFSKRLVWISSPREMQTSNSPPCKQVPMEQNRAIGSLDLSDSSFLIRPRICQ